MRTKPESGYLQVQCSKCREIRGVNEGLFYGEDSHFICQGCAVGYCHCPNDPAATPVNGVPTCAACGLSLDPVSL
jgi:hypothetical protein